MHDARVGSASNRTRRRRGPSARDVRKAPGEHRDRKLPRRNFALASGASHLADQRALRRIPLESSAPRRSVAGVIRSLVLALSLLGLATPARAQEPVWAGYASEIKYQELPGPSAGEHRNAYFWRPPQAPEGPLPVLYMMDGLNGLDIAVAELRPAIMAGRARPILVVATDAHPTLRTQEYVHWRRRTSIAPM